MRKLTLEEITAQRFSPAQLKNKPRLPVVTVLDNIRSLYNVGAIFRTADAVRCQSIYLCGITGTPPRKEIEKTALGATETVPWQYWPDAYKAIQSLKEASYTIAVLEHTDASQSHWDVSWTFPLALVVGNEVFGVEERILALADLAVEIPMFGAKQSLNVGVAYGVVMYHILYEYLKRWNTFREWKEMSSNKLAR